MRSRGGEGEVKVYECFGTERRVYARVTRVRESYANRRRTSRARVNGERLEAYDYAYTRVRERRREFESVENANKDLESAGIELLTRSGGKLFCSSVSKYRVFILE
jgi:hypothetical protein